MLARLVVFATVLLCAATSAQDKQLSIDPGLHHLGDTKLPAWEDVPAEPEGLAIDVVFRAQRNRREHVLAVTHQDVDNAWPIQINGAKVGVLRRGKPRRRSHHVLPAGTLKTGKNRLLIKCTKKTDDIIIGNIVLHKQPLRDVLRLQQVLVWVRDPEGGALPAKVTITDKQGVLAEHYYGAQLMTAVRPGIAYTGNGEVTFELPPGDYLLWASRGPEWSLAKHEIRVAEAAAGKAPVGPIQMSIAREVDTTGFVAADTHVHTLTHSGHGDASVEERMVTLAAEGVELAIATDHNHNTDYAPTQKRMHLHKHFKPVTGNEVTTKVGHFNAFPLDPRDKVPDFKLKDWIKLVDAMRAKGAKVVILNHPRWPRIPTGPFGVYHLNRLTGELPGRKAVPFDAMELVNSTQLQTDPLFLFVDWFALLNHGHNVTAVGSSDSHTVGDPVGQGRTYVRSSTDVPAKINVDEACAAFRRGDTTVSLGIFADVNVNGRYHMGHLVPARNRRVQASLRIAAASWVCPQTARLFLNGTEVAQRAVPVREGQPTDVKMQFDVELPAHDASLVCVVIGKGIADAFWRTMRPYTLAATNPVWLDADGDGRYQSPRDLAKAILERHGTKPGKLLPALEGVDDAVAVEALSLARAAYEKGAKTADQLRRARARLEELVGQPPARKVFGRYLKTLPSPEKAAARKAAGR
jgi:hypothetical protein